MGILKKNIFTTLLSLQVCLRCVKLLVEVSICAHASLQEVCYVDQWFTQCTRSCDSLKTKQQP